MHTSRAVTVHIPAQNMNIKQVQKLVANLMTHLGNDRTGQ